MTEKTDADLYPKIAELVTYNHDSLCMCGGRCGGWWLDFNEFTAYLRHRWGWLSPTEDFLGGETLTHIRGANA